MGDALIVAGPTFVWVTAGELTGDDVELDVETLVAFVLVGAELACELLRCEPAALREGGALLAKSASDNRLIVARYSCAPFWSDPPGTSNRWNVPSDG